MPSYDQMFAALKKIAENPFLDPEATAQFALEAITDKSPTLTERISKAIDEHRAANLDMKVSEIFDAFVEIDTAINELLDKQKQQRWPHLVAMQHK